MGCQYALSWLTVLPFELIAASITIQFWTDSINMAVWVTVFMVFLVVIQVFGVRGYGEGDTCPGPVRLLFAATELLILVR